MDSATIRDWITERLRKDPEATTEQLLQFWDLPGRAFVRPTGRLAIEPPVPGEERYYKLKGEEDQPPSAFRVRCWQQMRQANLAGALLDERLEECRSVREYLELDRLYDEGSAHVRRVSTLRLELDPVEDQDLLKALDAGTADLGPISPTLITQIGLFASYVYHACVVQGRPALIGPLWDVAALLGCSHRQACTVVALAQRKGLVERVPRREEFPEGEAFKDREGRSRYQRRDTNAYRPGPAIQMALMRMQGRQERERRARRPETPPPPGPQAAPGAAPGPATAAHQAPPVAPATVGDAGYGSREDRTASDPTPRRIDLQVRAAATPVPPECPAEAAPAAAPGRTAAHPAPSSRGCAARTLDPHLAPRSALRAAAPQAASPGGEGTRDLSAAGPPRAAAVVQPPLADKGSEGLHKRTGLILARGAAGSAPAQAPAPPQPELRYEREDGPALNKVPVPANKTRVLMNEVPAAVNELRYEREDSQPPPAQRPKRRHITPEEERRLPPWYEREIRAATLGTDIAAAIADVIERGALWLELTAAGRPAAEVDAAVEQLAVEQRAQRAGPGGASCRLGRCR